MFGIFYPIVNSPYIASELFSEMTREIEKGCMLKMKKEIYTQQ